VGAFYDGVHHYSVDGRVEAKRPAVSRLVASRTYLKHNSDASTPHEMVYEVRPE
jgi:hypothetical protein